ncbi:hypothetical protein LC613_40685 [Nostoc sphaeroides CHAB 2801]|uniref:hypothetical protein n=1 Tax=Nostoc sphaeroides TaxID=446679 RepID=UPI001E4F798F|nr:hypothetical protein [Nostoc sphaeroides]MCC5633740.1 hypothetical protein [Nostoc sphaeroides CHAB 2801]
MNNEEAKKALEAEVLDNTSVDTNIIEQPVLPNSTDPQDSHNNSRSPGKDRGGDHSVKAQN